ncbi:HutD/Ves family protein [Aquilutibacter rugosus]|uniref:HutD/Ves family protein n=1 Tax=Aquilutibacter rugosus TaxID=3115820 RepID=UPI002F40DEB3
MYSTVLLPTDSFVPIPWKNGGGITLDIFRGRGLERVAGDDWDWRLSMARLDGDGPFSAFDGIDRVLTFLGPGTLRLRGGATDVTLQPLQALAFDGAIPFEGQVDAPPSWDLNLMGRRERVQVQAETLPGPVTRRIKAGDVLGLLALQGDGVLGDLPVAQGAVGLLQATGDAEIRLGADRGAVVAFVVHAL